ncbi:MAG: endonuclease/exonuclease/phosphatase family protein [Bacteroidota bacterium]
MYVWTSLLFGLLVSSCNAQPITAPTEQKGALQLVTMTYNIRHGEGADGVVNLQRIANVILAAQPDLVAIQEVDQGVARTERVDQAAILADLTGMHMRFGFADVYQGGDFGNVILSRVPIDTLQLYPLPGPPGETRVLMATKVRFPLKDEEIPVTFMSTHLETIEAPRKEAAQRIAELMPEMPEELFVLGGDLNATPNAATLDTLASKFVIPTLKSHVFTHPANNPARQIDHILYAGPNTWTIDDVYTLNAPISSDHLPLVTVFTYTPQSTP